MGTAELHTASHHLYIRSMFICYGDAASHDLAAKIADDISSLWNDPTGTVTIDNDVYTVKFEIEGKYQPDLAPETVWYNDDPYLNFFRLEEKLEGNISFVDAIGSNTGCFQVDNLLQTASTAAHEYGHTLGLIHPKILDIRGGKPCSIMYPRGTLCDQHLQYDVTAKAGAYGGVLNPAHRRVFQSDIDLLKLNRLWFDEKSLAQVGEFSSIFHGKA